MINKLKVVGNITIYSTENTWGTYRNIVSVIKSKIILDEIKPISVRYDSDFDEKYGAYTSENNWGSNLDEYTIKLDAKLKATLSYYNVSRYSSKFENRAFKFEITFNLPKDLLPLFKNTIEREFYYKCVEIREKELEIIEENRIKEIGRELLKFKK